MKFSRYSFVLALLLGTVSVWAQNVNTEIDSLLNLSSKAKLPSERVKISLYLADEYLKLDDAVKRDELFDLAVQSSLLNDSLLFNTYNAYFLDDLHYLSPAKATEYATGMLSIAQNLNSDKALYLAYAALSKASIVSGNLGKAIDYINKAYYHASQLKDERTRAECMTQMGYCQEQNEKKIDAFRNYSDAFYLAEKIGDNGLKYSALEKLATFYFFLKKYEKAEYYRKRQYEILMKSGSVDSFKLMELNINLALILYGKEEISKAEYITVAVLQYTRKKHIWLLNNQAFKIYRTYLVDNGLFNELRDLYEKQYPEEYAKLAKEDTTLYYRLNGYILEANGKPDSAQLFYQMAEERLLRSRRGGISQANFYKRYGEFLLRRNNIGGAIQKFDTAYTYALKAGYFPYLIETTRYLDSLYYIQKDVDKAYQFAVLNKRYSDLQASVNKGEEMLQLEVENEARQQELKAEMERKDTERRDNLQYTFMVVAIIAIFILLTIIGSFKVHPGLIRAMGFFSFIFFFEFITMLADHQIHEFTHGVPWKFMAFKVVLIAILLPLHHWLEEKIIHYLIHHKLLDSAKVSLKMPLLRKKKAKAVVVEKPENN